MENLNVFNANEKPLENEYLTIGLSLELSLSFSHAPTIVSFLPHI